MLCILFDTLWRILNLDLHLRSYKAQIRQQLKPHGSYIQPHIYEGWLLQLQQQTFNADLINKRI